MNTIQVMHLVDNTAHDQYYGKDIHVIRLARELAAHEFLNMHLVCFREGWLVREARKACISVSVLPQRQRFDLRSIADVRHAILEKQAQILHMHGYKESVIGRIAGKLCGVSLVTTYHGWINTSFKLRIYNLIDLSIALFDDRLIAVSGPIKRSLCRNWLLRSKVITIRNGVDPLVVQLAADHVNELEASLVSDMTIPRVAAVGRLNWEKGFDIFLRAAAEIIGRGHRAWFIIIGDGPMRYTLKRLSAELGLGEHVVFTGFLPEAALYMQDVDIVVVASRSEGTPQVILEAMAASKPIVATDVGGIGELVVNGQTGLLVPSGKTKLLVDGIITLLESSSLRQQMGVAGKVRVDQEFSMRKSALAVAKVYCDLSAKRR